MRVSQPISRETLEEFSDEGIRAMIEATDRALELLEAERWVVIGIRNDLYDIKSERKRKRWVEAR
jgi:hypothetical protein